MRGIQSDLGRLTSVFCLIPVCPLRERTVCRLPTRRPSLILARTLSESWASKTSEQLPAVLASAQDVSDVSLIDAFIMRMGLAWLLAASLGCGFIGISCGAGSGAGSARPHRLRLPPAMGEKKLARASSESEGRPPDSRQAAVFRSRNNIRVPKTNDPAGRRGREVHGAGDGTRTREYKLGKLGPYHLATPACVKRIITHLFPFEKKHIFRHGMIGLPAEDAEGDFRHPPPDPRRSHYRNTRAD